MEQLIIFVISAIFTVIGYLFVPSVCCLIFGLMKKKLKHAYIITIIAINSSIVWLFFQIIRISLGGSGTSGAIFLWSGVAYAMMRMVLLEKKPKTIKPESGEVKVESINEVSASVISEDNNTTLTPAKKERNTLGLISLIVGIFSTVCCNPCLLGSIASIILGIFGITRANGKPKGFAIAGLILGSVSALIFFIALGFPIITAFIEGFIEGMVDGLNESLGL